MKLYKKQIDKEGNLGWRKPCGKKLDMDAINKAIVFIEDNFYPIKNINTKISSYGLKHLIEKKIGYISNGEFIIALLNCGYYCDKSSHINLYFNISQRSINQLRKQIQHEKHPILKHRLRSRSQKILYSNQ